MTKLNTIGIDLAKQVFQVHVNSSTGKKLISKKLKRHQLLDFLRQQPTALVAMEACSGAHYWGRSIKALGHKVRVIHPTYVKPFVQLHKNDQRDAQAIAEAAVRPNIPDVALKSQEQLDLQSIHRVRDRLVKEKTAIGNEIRGILMESGVVISRGHGALKEQVTLLLEDAENGLSLRCRRLINDLMAQWYDRESRVIQFDRELQEIVKHSESGQRLQSIPGIGAVNATLLLSLAGDASHFKSARCFSAYLGLVPKQHASGGKEQLQGISKHGNKHARRQLVHGARSAYNALKKKPDDTRLGQWLQRMEGKHPNKIIVALANKLARIVWAVLTKKVVYQA